MAVLRSRGSSRVAARGTLPPGGRRGRAAGTRRPVRCAGALSHRLWRLRAISRGHRASIRAVTSPGTCPERIARSCNRVGGLPTRALEAELAQRAFELGHTCSDALEVLIGEEEEPHRRARRDRGRPLSRQKGRDLAEGVARAECLGRLATVGQDSGLALFDEVDGGSVAVERGDRGTRLDLGSLTAPASSSSSVAGRSAKSGNDSIRLLSTGLDRATGSNRARQRLRLRLDVAARLIKTRTIVLAGSRRTRPSQRPALERARGASPSAPGRRGSWLRPS